MDEILIINGTTEYLCEDIGQKPEGFEAPTSRNVFINPPSRPGSVYINSLPGSRKLSWTGLIKSNIPVNRRLLGAACLPGNLKTIKFETCDGIALQTEIEVDSLTNPYTRRRSPYLIQATAPDFRFLSQTLQSANTGVTQKSGGMPIPAAIPGPIGGASGTLFIVNNAGNTLSEPILTIRGPGTNFLINNVTTGVKLLLSLSLLAGEEVIINTSSLVGTAYKGNQSVFGLITRTPAGKWVNLAPGNNIIQFSTSSGGNSNTRLTIQWRDAYSSI